MSELVCKCWEREKDGVTILRLCKFNCCCRCHNRPLKDFMPPTDHLIPPIPSHWKKRPYCKKHSRAMIDIGGEKKCPMCMKEAAKEQP